MEGLPTAAGTYPTPLIVHYYYSLRIGYLSHFIQVIRNRRSACEGQVTSFTAALLMIIVTFSADCYYCVVMHQLPVLMSSAFEFLLRSTCWSITCSDSNPSGACRSSQPTTIVITDNCPECKSKNNAEFDIQVCSLPSCTYLLRYVQLLQFLG